MAKGTKGSRKGKGKGGVTSVPKDVVAAAGDLIAAAQAATGPLAKRAAHDLGQLGQQLDAARATESKRLRKLAKAESKKGRKEIVKRRQQAGEAAAEVASLVGRIGERALSVAGGAAGAAGGAAREVGAAAATAMESVSPVRAVRDRVRGATPSAGARPTRPTRKRASTRKAAAAKPTAAKPAATTRKPAATKPAATTRKPAAKRSAPAAKAAAKPTTTRKPATTATATRKPAATRKPTTTRKPAATTRKPAATTRKPAAASPRRRPPSPRRRPQSPPRNPPPTGDPPVDRRPTEVSTSVSAGSPVGASVDLGSNSVHLLVAAIEGHELRPLVDESVFLGLGAAVDERAHLGPTARAELAATIARYAATARTHGATAVTLLGTEPIRRAADATRIVAEVAATSGHPLHVLTHEEEAYLTLVGVTGGSPVRDETLVVDIGGGSSEFGAVSAGGLARAAGLAPRLQPTDDPIRPHRPDHRRGVRGHVRRGRRDPAVGAAGASPATSSSSGARRRTCSRCTAAGVADRVLTRDRLREAAEHLLAEPAERLTTRFAVNPKRSPLLPAGAAIVEALMRHYDVDQVRVSDAGLREGAILAVGHAGRAWRDRLPALAHGWRS